MYNDMCMKKNFVSKHVACDLCFKDYGLRSEIFRGRQATKDKCPRCGHSFGTKVTYEELRKACHIFFQRGSYSRSDFGGANILMLFEDHCDDDFLVSNTLKDDLRTLSSEFNINVGYASPKTWQVGENDWLIKLSHEETIRTNQIDSILERCKNVMLNREEHFFRIRANIPDSDLLSPFAFDPPLKQDFKNGRFNLSHTSVFYGAFHVKTCLNESRVAVDDNIYVAKLKPRQSLNLIDFTKIKNDRKEDDSTNLCMAMNMLFSAGNSSYSITRIMSKRIYELKFDGVIYPSFFNQVSDKDYRNIVLFGHPIAEEKVEVASINTLHQKNISHDFSYGPVIKMSNLSYDDS